MKRLIITLCLAISLACTSFGGVGEITAASIGKATCKDDPKVCDNSVCNYATKISDGVKVWDMWGAGKEHMKEAKKRGLTCGVGETASEDHNCYKDPKLCGNIILCDLATTGNPKNWNTTYNTDHTMEAKLRGLTCGVEPVSVIAENVHGSKLPPCPEDTSKVFNNCYGYSDFEDGASYIGEWQNDKMHGIGTFTYPKEENGQYIGNFADNEFSGQGKLTFSDMTYEYEGNFKNDAFEGQGTLITEEGKFVGNFKDGELDGLGKHYDESGELIFEGQFAKGEPVQPHLETTPSGKDNDDGELIEGNLEAKSNPKCIPMSEAVVSLTPPDLALGILECYKVDEVQNALDMFWVMKVRAFFDAQRVNDESAGAAQGALQAELFAATGEDFLIEMQDLLDKDKEAFFSRLCAMMKTLGAPNYYPKYMILHGMNAFLGIEGDGLKPNFDADREWGKILRNNLSCKDKN